MLSLNAEGLLQKLGVAAAAIKSGERKDMGSPFRALTPEERAIFQSVIDELHRQFLAQARRVAARSRRTRRERSPTAASTPPQQALDHKLIDRIGYMPDALELARRAPASTRRA